MSGERHLTWHNFNDAFVAPGAPAIHPIAGEPLIELFAEAGGARIGLRTPLAVAVVTSDGGLASIQVEQLMIGGQRYLQIATSARSLYQPFFYLLLELADALQLQHLAPEVAVQTVISSWKDLLRTGAMLSPEQQVGLFGELWLLCRLARQGGPKSIDAWTGPWKEPHDFRTAAADIEVKATSGHRRKHSIHGLLQLEPIPGRRLYILSMSIARAGLDGQTLPAAVDAAASLFQSDAYALKRLQEGLGRSGYLDEHEASYIDRYSLRGSAYLVEVDGEIPRVSRALLERAWPGAFHRVGDVMYDLDLEGLGAPDGTPPFNAVLP